MFGTRRREFITLLGGAAVAPIALRLPAHAEAARVPTIGFMGASTPSAATQRIAALVQRLRELGWIEGRTVAIEYRWGEGRSERLAEFAAEFVRLKVDVIVTEGTVAVIASKQVTSAIPIVFPIAGDPIGSGLVASLARPGGNATGLSALAPDLAAKRLELLREIVPGLRRLAIMANVGASGPMQEMGEVHTAANTLGLAVATFEIRRAEDIASTFEAFKDRADALYICPDPLVNAYRVRINTLVLGARLPTVSSVRDHVEVGILLSYGPNLVDLYRRAADFVDKILRGAKPGDIPVEQPTKFDLVINLTTAKVLGLTIPPTLLARAVEVIE